MATGQLGIIENQRDMVVIEGTWKLDDDDFLLLAMLCDPIYCAELLFEDPLNHQHGGTYVVLDYQYPLFRPQGCYQAFPCGRSVGKTESIKARSVSHVFKRRGEDLLLTAPELIHLEALTQHVEERISSVRLTREFLKRDSQKTGFTHKPFQVDFSDGTRIIGRIPRLTGPQPYDAPLATPTGWTTMGEVGVGDRVLGSDGKPTRVLEVHEKGVRDVFRLELSDGSWVEATDDHHFPVRRDRSQPWQKLSVAEIKRHTEKQEECQAQGRQGYWYHVPDGVLVHYDDGPAVPLDPYLLGVMLGDAGMTTHTITFTNPDPEVVASVERLLPSPCGLERQAGERNEYKYRITTGGKRLPGDKAPLRVVLEQLGLWGCSAQTKRVPEIYMRASPADRLALLQGLLDTDGTCSKDGKVNITLDNRAMVEQLAEIGRSLGGWVSVREHHLKPAWTTVRGERYYNKGGTYWQATFDMGDTVPFRLARKAERCRGKRRKGRARAIKAVVLVRQVETRCISVAANDELYLSGFFIPVFNTGVKGMHEPDLIIDEAQDYPQKGWTEVHEPLPLDTEVLTPQGNAPLGVIRVGDEVLAVDGSATTVEGVFPQGQRQVLRVHFSDGTMVECDEEHEWTVGVPSTIAKGNWQSRSTRQIEEDLRKPGRACGSKRQPWHVPTAGPAQFDREPDLTVDPYILGLLLGDGCLRHNSVRFSTTDPELLDALRESLSPAEELRFAGGCDWWLRRRDASVHERSPLMDALDALALLGKRAHEKHVPMHYLYARIDDRLALLQGLVDSDGNIDKAGAVRFGTSSSRLAEDFAWLARSLGARCSIAQQGNGRFRRSYHVRARLPDDLPPARLARKAVRVKNGNVSRLNRRIVAVERTAEVKEMACIQVAHPAHLFLIKDFVACNNTVMKDHVDSTGKYDFTYHFYGVHAGANGGRFEHLAQSGEFKVTAITALMRPGWNKAEKAAAAAMYGGTHSPDYRRNILGEPGTALSQFFVSSRLMACLDQDAESAYNTVEFKDQHLMAEDVDKMLGPSGDIGAVLDLPSNLGQFVYGGMDVGLINDPTVIMLFAVQKDKEKRERLKLVRMLHLWRFRERQIREVAYRIDLQYGKTLRAFGQDITGMGLPLFQAMEDDERCPEHLREVSRGYTFNALVPVAVDENYVSEVGGKMVDQYGNMVKVERDKWTGQDRYVSYMTMIEASTRYLRNFVDQTFLLLPFHQGLVKDMQGETEQRVRAMGSPHLRKKPSAFHMLDAMRAMAMAYKSGEVEEMVLRPMHRVVLEQAVDLGNGSATGGGMSLR